MSTGKLIKLVHLAASTYAQYSRLIADRNEKGYGVIRDAEGRDIFFSHEVVVSRFGFDDLREGQQLDYTLESAPYLRANQVSAAQADAPLALSPAA
jgi:cold shock CspA family protein